MANESVMKSEGQGSQPQTNNQEQDNGQRSSASQGKSGAKQAASAAKNAFKTARKTVQTAQKVIKVARVIAAASNPAVLIAIGVVIAILLIYLIFFSSSSALDLGSESNPITPAPAGNGGTTTGVVSVPGLTITLTGPPESPNGVDITYDVTATYDPAVGKVPIEDIVLYDTIPKSTTFVSTDGVQADDSTTSTVTWSLKDPANQKLFHIVLHPNDDSYIVNAVNARITGGASGGTSPQEFQNITKGQGRNTSVLGDRASFIATIIANSEGPPRLPLAGKESYLGQIYDAANDPKYNVNPLILTVIWGVESSFDTTGTLTPYPFGCKNPPDAGFTENVTCAAGSLNALMSAFETHSSGGLLEIPSVTGNTCMYADAFDYAYEEYTPVCHASDGNAPERTTFIGFYKQLRGQ